MTSSVTPLEAFAPVLMESIPKDTIDDITQALGSMGKSYAGYEKADLYAKAVVPEVFASQRQRRAMQRSGITYQLNFAKTVIESVVDRLDIASITCDDQVSDEEIQAIREANKLGLQITNWLRKACTFGDAYVIVWPKEGAEEPYKPEDIRMHYQDPRTVRVFYDDDDPLVVEYAAKKWKEDKRVRLDLYYDDRIESYISKIGTKGKDAKDYEPCTGTGPDDGDADEDDDNPTHITMHNFGQVPVFHFRTDADEYGDPEHIDFYSIVDILHKLALGHMSGVDYQAFPQRYALMMDDTDTTEAERLDSGLYSFGMQEQGTTENYGGEGRSQFKADPGSVWMAEGIKAFGQFDVASSANFTDPMEFYLRCGATISNTPLHYFDPSGQTPSGESLKTAEAPFVKKVETRKESFGDTLRQIFTFALKLIGNDNIRVVVTWKPSASTDDQSTWTVARLKQDAGVPTEQTLVEAGYTDTQVAEWESKGEMNLPQKVALLEQIGQAVASLSTGVTAGVIDGTVVQALIVKVMGSIDDDDTRNPD